MDNLTLYCLYHKLVNTNFYGDNIDSFTFVKMDSSEFAFNAKNHIDMQKMDDFISYGSDFAEYEFFLNLYHSVKNGKTILSDYVGFIHNDMLTMSTNYKEYLVDFLNRKKLTPKSLVVLRPFATCHHPTIFYFYEKYKEIEDLHNSIFPNKIDVKQWRMLPMCGAFVIHKSTFMKLMEYVDVIVKNWNMEQGNRMAGNILERYVAVLILSFNLNIVSFPIKHYLATFNNTDISQIKIPDK